MAKNNGVTLGFEETLWQAVDKMRGHKDPSGLSAESNRLEYGIRKNLKGLEFNV